LIFCLTTLAYLKRGVTKDTALRQAKLDYLNTFKSAAPFRWAGFIAIGDMEAMKK
jgi:CHAT domain-containing protein